MKFLVVAVLVGAVAAQDARFSGKQLLNEIVITRSEHENPGDGNFRWASELSDGSRSEQNGYLKAGPDPETPIQVIQGTFSYISPEGQTIDLSYIADENGFQPQGVHVPRLPGQLATARAIESRPVQVQSRPVVQAQPQTRYVEDQQRYEQDSRLVYEQPRTTGQYQPRPIAPRTSYTQPRL